MLQDVRYKCAGVTKDNSPEGYATAESCMAEVIAAGGIYFSWRSDFRCNRDPDKITEAACVTNKAYASLSADVWYIYKIEFVGCPPTFSPTFVPTTSVPTMTPTCN